MSYELITGLFIALLVSLILSLIFKKKEKKDSGFVITYYKLSYRRKMIRTLWIFPIAVISLTAIYLFVDENFNEILFVSIFLLVLFLLQLFYNYFKWKKYER